MALLNEILGSMSVEEGDFSREWTEVFGDTEEGTSAAPGGPAEAEQKENSFFLPSQLLDQSLNHVQSSLSGQPLKSVLILREEVQKPLQLSK